MSQQPQLWVNQRYGLEELLGKGGMGEVYRASDRLNGNTVALKRVTASPGDLVFNSRAITSSLHLALAQEFQTLASLRHPHIISVLDYGFDENRQPYFTMEYLENAQSIVQAAEDMSFDEKIVFVLDTLQALIYLHHRGILHRDLKPDNVLVVNGQVKVMDFGLSLVTKGSSEAVSEVAGTVAYMAPELFQGDTFSKSADLYAMGLITYELLAGRFPFKQDNVGLLLNEIMNTPIDMSLVQANEAILRVLNKLLIKNRTERYDNAREVIREVCSATNRTIPTETEAIRESFLQAAKFVGRATEMTQLWQVWKDVAAGTGSVWLVGGESGVGKSRLLDELRIRTLVDGGLVLQGQAIREGAEPHAIWRDAIRRLCLHTELSDRDASVLKALIPDINTLQNRHVDDAPEIDQQAKQERLITIIEKLFRQQQQPVILLLEDLQWASDDLPILSQLCRVISELKLLIVASYRDDENPGLPEKIPNGQLLNLRRFNKTATAELSAAMLGDKGKEAKIVDLIARETEGNVFFIVEMVRALAEEAGQLDKIDTQDLPQTIPSGSVEEIVQRRLNRVPQDAQQRLRLAAVAGRELDLKLVRSLEHGIETDEWLTTCANASILEVQDNQWRFSHHKLREQLLADLSQEENRELHKQVAVAATALYADDPAWATHLAYFWTQAGNIDRAFEFSSLAGTLALRASAYRDAANHLKQALALSKQLKIASPAKAELQYQLGQVHIALGNPMEAQPYLEAALGSLDLAVYNTTPSLGFDLLKQVVYQFGHRRLPKRLFKTNKSQERQDVLLRASNIYELLGEMHFYANRSLPSMHAVFKCANYAEAAHEDTRQLAVGYGTLGVLLSAIPLHRIAEGYIQRALDVADRVGDQHARGWTLFFAGYFYSGMGQWERARTYLDEATAIHTDAGDHRRRNSSLIAQTFNTVHHGDFEQTLKLAELIEPQAKRHNDVQMLAWTLLLKIQVYYHTQQENVPSLLEEAQHLLSQELSLGDQIWGYGLSAWTHLRIGKVEIAEEQADKALELMQQTRPLAFYSYLGYAGTAATYLGLWENKSSTTIQERAKSAMKSLALFARIYPFAAARAQLYQSRYDWLAGKKDKAQKDILKTLETAQTMQMPYDEGLTYHALGQFLSGNDSEYQQYFQKAIEVFTDLGATRDVTLVKEVLEQSKEVAV